MKVIRNSLFETNSSSMHSIAYLNVRDKSLTELTQIKDGCLTIDLDEYEGGKILKAPDQKLSYICTWLLDNKFWFNFLDEDVQKLNYHLTDMNDFYDISEDLESCCSSGDLDTFRDLLEFIANKYKLKQIKFNLKTEHTGINWQSKEVLEEFMWGNPDVTYEKLIFDPCYIIVVDWDSGEYLDKDGNYISGYVDADNHCIDATRYALNLIWKKKGQ